MLLSIAWAVGWVTSAASGQAKTIKVGGTPEEDKACQKAIQEGDWNRAVASCAALVEKSKGDGAREVARRYWTSVAYSKRKGRIGAAPATVESVEGDRTHALEHASIAWDLVKEGPKSVRLADYALLGRQLGECLRLANRLNEAIEVYQTLLRNLPEPTLDRSLGLHALGETFLERALQGSKLAERNHDVEQGLRCEEEALRAAQGLPNCPMQLLAAIHNSIGLLYVEQGKSASAVSVFAEAERISRDLKDPTQHAKVLVNLINTHLQLGHYEMVRALCSGIRDNAHVGGHPRVLAALGLASLRIGQYAEAGAYFDLARTKASESPDCKADQEFLVGLDINSAATAQETGDFSEAQHYLQAAERRVKQGVVDSRTAIVVRANRGRMYLTLERLNEAREELDAAREMFSNLSGPQHPDTLQVLGDLANLGRARGYLDDALELSRQVVAGWIAVYGEGHPEVARARLECSKIYRERKDCEEAVKLSQLARESLDGVLGPDHKLSVNALLDAVLLWRECPQLPDAAAVLNSLRSEAEARFRRFSAEMGAKNVEVLRGLVMSADIAASVPATQTFALESYERAEVGFRELYGGGGALSIAQIRLRHGTLLAQLGRLDEALTLLDSAQRQVDPSLKRHPTRAWILAAMGDIQKRRGGEQAAQLLQEANDILISTYGAGSSIVEQFQVQHAEK